ncbi:MAG: ABC transporter permease [Thermoplasmata archaeon]|nr:MAG: ABC transporter permease [Thermoplasmata archaeon]
MAETKVRKPKSFKGYDKRTFAWIIALILLISIIGVALYLTGNPSQDNVLRLATTTSTANSGLLDFIIPDFEKEYNCSVWVTPVGTGQALEMGRRGDVDVLMVHAPSREAEFVKNGYGTARYPVFYNYFVLVGPPENPAGINSIDNSSEALNRIFNSKTNFVSRGDESGTHTKEKELWEAAGFDYESEIDIRGNDWYLSVSAGMGDTLIRSNELTAYTLSDEGTFWAFEGNLDLDIILREDENLINPYSVIPVNPAKFSHVNYRLALQFVDWITENSTQQKIGAYEQGGHQLFVPIEADLPLVDIPLDDSSDTERLIGITLLTLYVAGCSTIISSLIGIPIGTYLGLRKTRFALLIKVFTHTLYGLPPVIAGLLVFILLSRAGPLGEFGILFTPTAMIFAQVILVTPLIIGLSASAIGSIPNVTVDTARTLGAKGFTLLKTLIVESRIGMFTAVMVGFGRAISEVGAVIIVGGNIKWHTQVLTTAIVDETQKGNFDFALVLGGILITLALITSIILTIFQRRYAKRPRKFKGNSNME